MGIDLISISTAFPQFGICWKALLFSLLFILLYKLIFVFYILFLYLILNMIINIYHTTLPIVKYQETNDQIQRRFNFTVHLTLLNQTLFVYIRNNTVVPIILLIDYIYIYKSRRLCNDTDKDVTKNILTKFSINK